MINTSAMRITVTKPHGVCLPSNATLASFSCGLTFAGDRVSNSISQVFIYYFPFQSRSAFFFFSNFPSSTPTLEKKKKKRHSLCNFHRWQPSASHSRLITKILAPFSVKITHCRRPYVIWTGGFVTEK